MNKFSIKLYISEGYLQISQNQFTQKFLILMILENMLQVLLDEKELL